MCSHVASEACGGARQGRRDQTSSPTAVTSSRNQGSSGKKAESGGCNERNNAREPGTHMALVSHSSAKSSSRSARNRVAGELGWTARPVNSASSLVISGVESFMADPSGQISLGSSMGPGGLAVPLSSTLGNRSHRCGIRRYLGRGEREQEGVSSGIGSETGLNYFRGCRAPRSFLSHKRGGHHTELVTCGFWAPSLGSLYPHHRERERKRTEKREIAKERSKRGRLACTAAETGACSSTGCRRRRISEARRQCRSPTLCSPGQPRPLPASR